ncbi:MAG: hypothetical protein IJA69_06515 [Clostridia bacterium]|nr:hypothetical protein [Clostridia bacterium]
MEKRFSCYTPSPYYDFRECNGFHPNPCTPQCPQNNCPHIPQQPNCSQGNENCCCIPNCALLLIGGIIIGRNFLR